MSQKRNVNPIDEKSGRSWQEVWRQHATRIKGSTLLAVVACATFSLLSGPSNAQWFLLELRTTCHHQGG